MEEEVEEAKEEEEEEEEGGCIPCFGMEEEELKGEGTDPG